MRSNRSPKSPLRLFVISLLCMTATLFNEVSEASLKLPSYRQRQSLFGSAGLEEETIPQPEKWSSTALHLTKRDKGNPMEMDERHYLSKDEMDKASKGKYKVVPDLIIYASQIIHKGVNCSSIRADMHKNHISSDLKLNPKWIHDVEFIGSCPTHYVTRELPPMYSPSVVVEAVCTCPGSRCSSENHYCVPITRHIPVWVRKGPNYHVMDVEEITIACTCLRRPAIEEDFAFTYALSD